MKELGDDEVWLNNRYQVNVRWFHTPWGDMRQLSIKRIDKRAERDWRVFQRIKNEIAGPYYEAVEIYPSESRLVDTANQYHLWVLPANRLLPFGMFSRLVSESEADGSRQRRWDYDQKPPDLMEIEKDGDEVLVKLDGKEVSRHDMKNLFGDGT